MKTLLAVLLCAVVCAASGHAQDIEAGKKQFEAICAGCHGADGAGGEHAPSIVDMRRRGGNTGRPSQNLSAIIRNGIPEGGMPPFPLPPAQLDALVAFIDALRAPAADHPTPGNAQAGESFFRGKGRCTSCHMIRGQGGTIGPDLSSVARTRRLGQIEQALRHPETLTTPGYRPVTLRLNDGRTLRGLAKNESNYDLQFQAMDGTLHFFTREQIAEESHQPPSLMPAVDATDTEMRDLLAFLTRLTGEGPVTVAASGTTEPRGANPFSEIADPKQGDWPTYNGNLSGNRHSPLEQINTGNVAQLGAKWMFPIANARRLEVTPVVVDGVMYVTTANQAYAVDAQSGRQVWHYSRPLTGGVIGDASSAINRGVAVLGEKVFLITDNAHLLALNRFSGQLLWDTEMADYRQGYGATAAPLVVNNLVLSGTSGGDEGARGFVAAFDAETGKQVWRFWNMPAPGEPGSETWVGRAIEHGCAAGWLTGSYDPTTNLIYWPTGNPCPDYNGDERKGDNLYANSVVALDPQTGKLKWYYQFTPHDLHDWDATEPLVLFDAEFHGRPRKLLAQANRNGFFYVLDRVTGEFLVGEPFVHNLTWASGIGPDGRPKVLPDSIPTPEGVKVCPAVIGATNWMATAYNPAAGLFYVNALESCGVYTKSDAWWEPGKSFYGGTTRRAPGERSEKFLRAIDIQTGKIVWEYPHVGAGGGLGGVLSTAGGLVFLCEDSGAFAALDAKTGKPLWHFHTNESWHASPMTYMVNGRQYVAVAAGTNIVAFALP